MFAFRFIEANGKSVSFRVPGPVHQVEVEGADFVARCGERWLRTAEGGVYERYFGRLCSACEAT